MPEGFDRGENGDDFNIIDYKLADIEDRSFRSARPLSSGPPPDCRPCRTVNTPTDMGWLYVRLEAGRHPVEQPSSASSSIRRPPKRGLGIAPNLRARARRVIKLPLQRGRLLDA
jgi:hypothetical protein